MLNVIAGLVPYGFMDFLRDEGMIPSEAPREIVHRTSAGAVSVVRQWIAVQGYSFMDLLDEAAVVRAKHGAQVARIADAVAARVEQTPANDNYRAAA